MVNYAVETRERDFHLGRRAHEAMDLLPEFYVLGAQYSILAAQRLILGEDRVIFCRGERCWVSVQFQTARGNRLTSIGELELIRRLR
jgi:hypothetical protein